MKEEILCWPDSAVMKEGQSTDPGDAVCAIGEAGQRSSQATMKGWRQRQL